MAYQSAKQKRENAHRRKGLFLMSIAICVLAGGTFAYNKIITSHIEIDPVSLCPVDGPTAITAVLIDSTDPFTSIQVTFLQKYFSEILDSVDKYALIHVYSASHFSESALEPIVSLCNPGDGKDASDWNANPEKLRRKWQELFDEPLRNSLNAGITSDGSDNSPLFEILQNLSIHAYPLNRQSLPMELYIVSDMLEHTSNYSQYSDADDFQSVSSRAFLAHLSPNLINVNVTVLYVGRKNMEQIQTTSHAEFWAAYFKHAGARLRVIKRI